MTQAELEQWRSSGIIHVDDHERTHNAATALLTTGGCSTCKFACSTGRRLWTRARCVPCVTHRANIVRYVTSSRRRRSERASQLLAAEVKFAEHGGARRITEPGSGGPHPSSGKNLQRLFLQYSLDRADNKHFEVAPAHLPMLQ